MSRRVIVSFGPSIIDPSARTVPLPLTSINLAHVLVSVAWLLTFLVQVTLIAIPASHPCAAAEAMLLAKRVPYQRVDLIPAFSRAWLRLIGFDGVPVPALRIADVAPDIPLIVVVLLALRRGPEFGCGADEIP